MWIEKKFVSIFLRTEEISGTLKAKLGIICFHQHKMLDWKNKKVIFQQVLTYCVFLYLLEFFSLTLFVFKISLKSWPHLMHQTRTRLSFAIIGSFYFYVKWSFLNKNRHSFSMTQWCNSKKGHWNMPWINVFSIHLQVYFNKYWYMYLLIVIGLGSTF